MLIIVLKSNPARRVNLGLEPSWVEEKIGKEKIQCDQADLAKPSCNPLTFVFLTKMTSFWFKKKKNRPERPGRNPEPGP